MKKITNPREIEKAIDFLGLSSEFDTTGLDFEIRVYEKGEHLVSPLAPLSSFNFIVSGSVKIYQLDEDSTLHSIVDITPHGVLGYNEFAFENDEFTLYGEAESKVTCLILPYRQRNRNLKDDSRFLLFLLKSYLTNQIQHTKMIQTHSELEDKLLFYIENMCIDQTLENVNNAVTAVGCSRRQLQRVLKKLCDDGVLVHSKRGLYTYVSRKTD